MPRFSPLTREPTSSQLHLRSCLTGMHLGRSPGSPGAQATRRLWWPLTCVHAFTACLYPLKCITHHVVSLKSQISFLPWRLKPKVPDIRSPSESENNLAHHTFCHLLLHALSSDPQLNWEIKPSTAVFGAAYRKLPCMCTSDQQASRYCTYSIPPGCFAIYFLILFPES